MLTCGACVSLPVSLPKPCCCTGMLRAASLPPSYRVRGHPKGYFLYGWKAAMGERYSEVRLRGITLNKEAKTGQVCHASEGVLRQHGDSLTAH